MIDRSDFMAALLFGCGSLLFAGQVAQAQTAIPAWTAFEQLWSTITAYTATVAIFEREGAQVQSSVLDYTFRKPTSATVHFLAGKNTGVTVAWSGGATVVAHRGNGLMGLFKKTFPSTIPP